jgi:Cys-rich protein (TIGR01571 family)
LEPTKNEDSGQPPAGISAGGEDDDDDDDDDDGDDQTLGNASTQDKVGLASKHLSESYDGEEMRIVQTIQKAESDLAANLRQQYALKNKMSVLLDKEKSDKEIDDSAVLVANQTESVAMATMLSNMWKDMRMFEVPSYASHVEREVHRLKEEEKDLEKKMHVEQAKLVEYRRKRTDEARKKKEAEQSARQAEIVKATAKSGGGVTPDLSGAPEMWKDANMNTNFWNLSRDQKIHALEHYFVFLLLAVLCAFLYRRASNYYPTFFSPAPLQASQLTDDKNFTFGLFSCFDDRNICLLGCLCPYLRWSDTLDRKKLLAYPKAVALMVLMVLLQPFTAGLSCFGICALGVFFRQKLRARYEIQRGTRATVFWDVATWLFCQPCAICQEAREEVVRST